MENDDDKEFRRLIRQTTRELAEETAQLQAHPYRAAVIAMVICITLGLSVVFGLVVIGQLVSGA